MKQEEDSDIIGALTVCLKELNNMTKDLLLSCNIVDKLSFNFK